VIGLGIDAGGSSTRWLLRDRAGKELGEGVAGPITGHVFTPADLDATVGRLRALLAEAASSARPDAVVAGITGFHPQAEASEALGQAIADTLGLERSRVLLVDDMHIAYASVFAPGAGVLVYAGTGSVAYHMTASGRLFRVGGYGYLVDDAGAGYWIGHRGIRQAMRWIDEGVAPSHHPLSREIFRALGSDAWEDIVVTVYGGGRQRVAALAPAVAAAASEGDEVAVAILRQAGEELARLGKVLFHRIGSPLPVAFAGGISRLHPIVNESLRAALPAGTSVDEATVEPVSAAARLAVELSVRG
jgi:glucosamine kinase